MKALLWDCDGVIADTERDGHRVAFNRAFREAQLAVEWDVALYGELLKVAGGKERMTHFFEARGWPVPHDRREGLVKRLHLLKTENFTRMIEAGEIPIRSGVARLVDAANAAGVKLAVCSTSNERSVVAVVERLLGPKRYPKFSGIFAGDIVTNKKPAPDIYELAARRLEVAPAQCVAIEDSRNGLLAALRAGMTCLVTTSAYTVDEPFKEAARVVPELGDPPSPHVTLDDIRRLAQHASHR